MALLNRVSAILSINDSPQKIAISFAIGIFIGMSPFLGIHTLLGIVVASLFRLNKFVTIVGVYITNPWTIIPIYSFATWFGARLLGIEKVIPNINWSDINFAILINDLKFLLIPFVVGSTLLGFLTGLTGYIIIYHAVKRRRK